MRKNKIKNFILKTITGFFALLAVFSCCIDGESWWIPLAGFCASMVWLIPFGLANGYLKREGGR